MVNWGVVKNFSSTPKGKLYGTMDDLRLEHHRVQAKYIATWRHDHFSPTIGGPRADRYQME